MMIMRMMMIQYDDVSGQLGSLKPPMQTFFGLVTQFASQRMSA